MEIGLLVETEKKTTIRYAWCQKKVVSRLFSVNNRENINRLCIKIKRKQTAEISPGNVMFTGVKSMDRWKFLRIYKKGGTTCQR